MDNSKNKIAIISTSLCLGGAEKFASSLSFMLSDLGFEIHNIIIEDEINYNFKGHLVNLGVICENNNYIVRKFKKGIFLKKYLNKNNISTIIDNRSRPILLREFFAKWIYKNRKIIYMVHISKLEMYLTKPIFLSKLIYNSAHKIVCVSKTIESDIIEKYRLKNTITIYNPIPDNSIQQDDIKDLPQNFFIYFGRLEEKQKNLSLMLESFKVSKIYEKDFKLILIGDGKSKSFLEQKIIDLNLSKFVEIKPFSSHVLSYVKMAKASVLTSNFEGFPMSIIESLSVGIPVISVDCPTGPNEIIINEFNGLLVENNNKNQIANAFKRFTLDEELYQICKLNSQKSIEHLSIETIAEQWEKLIKS
jgi:glycosyltransferase involved in cell wall biosynthesis